MAGWTEAFGGRGEKPEPNRRYRRRRECFPLRLTDKSATAQQPPRARIPPWK